MMDDLIAFITARLDEEYASADLLVVQGDDWHVDKSDPGTVRTEFFHVAARCSEGELTHSELRARHIALYGPGRAKREAAAKRAIVRRCGWSVNEPDQYPNGLVSPRAVLARQNLSDLAAAWNDHPDYRAEWKF